MIALIVALSSLVLPLIHLGLSRHPRTRGRVVRVLLLYALVLDVGVIGLPLGFIPHVFFPNQAADLLGWPPGSPFQLEVGFHDGAWGLLGFLSIWIGGSFWLATGLGRRCRHPSSMAARYLNEREARGDRSDPGF